MSFGDWSRPLDPKSNVWFLERAVFTLSCGKREGALKRQSFSEWPVPSMLREQPTTRAAGPSGSQKQCVARSRRSFRAVPPGWKSFGIDIHAPAPHLATSCFLAARQRHAGRPARSVSCRWSHQSTCRHLRYFRRRRARIPCAESPSVGVACGPPRAQTRLGPRRGRRRRSAISAEATEAEHRFRARFVTSKRWPSPPWRQTPSI